MPSSSSMPLCTLLALAAIAGPLPADAAPADRPVSSYPTAELPNFAPADGWTVGLGAEVEYSVDYDGSDDYEAEFEPGVLVHVNRGDFLYYLEGNTAGVRYAPGQDWIVGAGLQYEFGRDESDNAALAGLGDTDAEWVATLDVRRGFGGDNWPWWVAARALVGGSDIGALGVVGIGRELPVPSAAWQADIVAYATFATSDFQARDFGITPAQSLTSGYAPYDPDGGFRALGLQAYAQYAPTRRIRLIGQLGYEGYSSDATDSPLVQAGDDGEFEASLSFLFLLR
jgi:outer membrane protein